MTKEKLESLNKYLNGLKDRLNTIQIPKKHKDRPESYHTFLKHEIETVSASLEAAKLEGIK